MGLELAQGLSFIAGFYWDRDEKSAPGQSASSNGGAAMPTMSQAGVYSAVRHYLKSVDAATTTSGTEVANAMRSIPVTDMFTKSATLRPDGRLVHDMLLVEVKSPGESRYPWDYYKIRSILPGSDAFRPLADGGCPLVRT